MIELLAVIMKIKSLLLDHKWEKVYNIFPVLNVARAEALQVLSLDKYRRRKEGTHEAKR